MRGLAKAITDMKDYVLLLLGSEYKDGYEKIKNINPNVIHIDYINYLIISP